MTPAALAGFVPLTTYSSEVRQNKSQVILVSKLGFTVTSLQDAPAEQPMSIGRIQ